MAYTGVVLNPGSGGVTVASQLFGGNTFFTSTLAWGADGSAQNLVCSTNPLPVYLGDSQAATYGVGVSGLVPAAAATDVFELNNGAGTKVLKLSRLWVSGLAGSAITVDVQLIKRSTLNTVGTSTTPTIVPFDSSDSAATGVVKAYTANPTTGNAIGTVASAKLTLPLTAAAITVLDFNFGRDANQKAVVLRANQSLVVNLNGASVTSGALNIWCSWSEF